MDVGFKTDRGRKRANNEDAFFILKNDGVFIVADGVGGSKSGEIASRTAVNEVAAFVQENTIGETEEEIKDFFLEAVKMANDKVYGLSERFAENTGMASTLVLAYIDGKNLYVVNIGDSRAYLFDQGRLKQISEDHTYVNALLNAGVITEGEAKNRKDKNMITRAIGAEATVEADIYKVKLKAGDKILLCSDGLYGEINEIEMAKVFDLDMSMTDTCLLLVDMANANGGHDNITAICIAISEDDLI